MELSDGLRERAGNTENYDDREKYLDQAREMEDGTHMLLKGQNA